MKKLSLFLLITLLISGCSAQTTKEQLVVGMECNSAPFNWLQTEEVVGSIFVENANGYCAGYDVVVATELAKHLDRELVVKAITWEGLIPALNSGDIDAIIAGMSKTPDRSLVVNFSEPYYYSDYVMVVPADSPYKDAKTLEDFSGSELVGQLNTNYEIIIDQIPNVTKQPSINSIPVIVNAIKSGTVDGTPIEKPIGQSIVSTNPELILVEFDEGQGFVQTEDITTAVSIAISKENEELLNQVNEYLESLTQEQRDTWMSQALEASSNQ